MDVDLTGSAPDSLARTSDDTPAGNTREVKRRKKDEVKRSEVNGSEAFFGLFDEVTDLDCPTTYPLHRLYPQE